MPDPVTAVVVGGSAIGGSLLQAKAAGKAADVQAGAAEKGIAEQRSQFDAMIELLKPYVEVGKPAIGGFGTYQAAGLGAVPTLQKFAAVGAPALEEQQAISGLLGPERQAQAIAKIEQGAGYQAQVKTGERAILQQASATGGLRGGNIQAALGQYRPALLQQAIDQQYGRLGGLAATGGTYAQNLATAGQGATEFLSRLGQASAAGQAAGGERTASNIANLLAQQGQARAGGELGEAKAYGQILNLPSQILGFQAGAQGRAGPVGFGNIF
jgi:hypothetical protein